MLISKNIYLIRGRGYASNSYLVLGDEIILVDTGTPENVSNLINSIVALGVKIKDINLIVNTHAHFDHIGGNSVLKENSSAELAAFMPDALYISKADIEFILPIAGEILPAKVERVLSEGEKINGFEVVNTPGHTEGSICLYDSKNKTLISGDTLFGDGSVGRTDLRGGNVDALETSLKKLKKMNIEKILPGHGEPCLNNVSEILKEI